MFSDDESFSTDSSKLHGRTEQSSPVEQQMACHLTNDSFQDVPSEEEVEEHLATASLGDDIWMDEPVPDRHLCIHEQSQAHDLCPYPCPNSLDQLNPTPAYAPTPHYMDSSTSLISQMWWQPPVMKIYLVWMMFLDFEYGQ